MSAGRIDVGRLAMSCMPATALKTVWPEETVAPTTRCCVKVCYIYMSAKLILKHTMTFMIFA